MFYLKSTNAIENCFPDVGSVKTASSECMIANCLEPGEHHLELRKPSPLWGTYQLKKMNIGDIKHLEICEGHMKKETERHTWALTSMAKLTVQELDCYLCKKKSVYTNTTRHCVKHMICVAEESCHVPCGFFDMNDGHFIHSRHSSNHFVCHCCKDMFKEIQELEKQHQKYLQMITSIKPAIPHSRQKLEKSVPDLKNDNDSSIDNSLQKLNQHATVDLKNDRHIDSSLQKLNQYAVYYLQKPYRQWEVHVHSENEVSLLRWNKSTWSAAKRLTIRGHNEEYILEFKLWEKNIDSIPNIPLKPDDLHSKPEEFHKDVINYLDELDMIQFCEGYFDTDVIKSLENIPHPNGFIDRNRFAVESGIVENTVRSTSCTFHSQASKTRCVHCSTLYRSTLCKRKKGNQDSRKDVSSKMPSCIFKSQ